MQECNQTQWMVVNALWSGLLLFWMVDKSSTFWLFLMFFHLIKHSLSIWIWKSNVVVQKLCCEYQKHVLSFYCSVNEYDRKRMKYLVCNLNCLSSFSSVVVVHRISHVQKWDPTTQNLSIYICDVCVCFFSSEMHFFPFSLVWVQGFLSWFRLDTYKMCSALIYIFQCLVFPTNCMAQATWVYFQFDGKTKWKIGDGRSMCVLYRSFYCYIFSLSFHDI